MFCRQPKLSDFKPQQSSKLWKLESGFSGLLVFYLLGEFVKPERLYEVVNWRGLAWSNGQATFQVLRVGGPIPVVDTASIRCW